MAPPPLSHPASASFQPGRGKTTGYHKRHQKVLRDNIKGVTKPAIRRIARRGGVKRISAAIYDEARVALRERLTLILNQLAIITDQMNRKTVTVTDVIFVLKRLGTPIYGFDPSHVGRRG